MTSIVTVCTCTYIHCRRLSDIIRRGKRHFRRSLTRGRSEDDHPPPSIYPHPSLDHHPHHSHHSHHTTRVVTPPKAAPVRSSSFSLTVDHPLAGETQGGGDVTITTIAPPLPGHHEAARNTTREGDSGKTAVNEVNIISVF